MAGDASGYVEFNPTACLQLDHWRRGYSAEKNIEQTIGYGCNAVGLTTCQSHTLPESIYKQEHVESITAEGEITFNRLLSGITRTLMQNQNDETTRRFGEKKIQINQPYDVVNPTRFLLTRGPNGSPEQICASTAGT
jgi:hypothetical protein